MYQHILYETHAASAVITMNRPDRLNALTVRMLAEIKHALARAEKDPQVTGIVLTGAGRGFSAGMDMDALDEISTTNSIGAEGDDLSALKAEPGDASLGEDFQVTYAYLLSIRKPLIAAVNGACAGLAFSIAMLCDLRFVAQDAKFTTAFSQRGLVAEHGVSWILPRLIGPSRALDLLWSARKFDGFEADRLGLADRLCAPGETLTSAQGYIEHLAATASPTSLMIMKQQVYRHLMLPLGEAMQDTNTLMAESLTREDFREGVRSFVERRAPRFNPLTVEE